MSIDKVFTKQVNKLYEELYTQFGSFRMNVVIEIEPKIFDDLVAHTWHWSLPYPNPTDELLMYLPMGTVKFKSIENVEK
jgi:hypothetical protein